MRLPAVLSFVLLATFVGAGKRCVSVIGVLRCEANETLHQGVQIDLFDRDGVGVLQHIDADDHSSFAFSNEKGQFMVDGCSSDFDWLWIRNDPDPYVRITHQCHGKLDKRELPVFYKFMPSTHDYGTIVL